MGLIDLSSDRGTRRVVEGWVCVNGDGYDSNVNISIRWNMDSNRSLRR
jgi:hypothetical protein